MYLFDCIITDDDDDDDDGDELFLWNGCSTKFLKVLFQNSTITVRWMKLCSSNMASQNLGRNYFRKSNSQVL